MCHFQQAERVSNSTQDTVGYFHESPSNLTSSLGKDVKLTCLVLALGEAPEISWLKDGEAFEIANINQIQVPLDEEEWMTTSELR
ncbi:tyrosine-protein kinase receptor UFO-like isoform X2 [Thamnophis elegans]|uniref:tyrosine-protein kinase receptor UFO-like isoform X2 n=1 Tax=Thamnophis elegans TaxID=35005 RepID=UPI001377854D|nr:tyrosine-protein kinase receptor UFO-like isoform X2 [Thamnophis elegans]